MKGNYEYSFDLFYIFFEKLFKQIEGTWAENKCIEGRWILPNGNYFEGKLENNKPSGAGKWYFKNGNVLEGNFKQDAFEDEVVIKNKIKEKREAMLCLILF